MKYLLVFLLCLSCAFAKGRHAKAPRAHSASHAAHAKMQNVAGLHLGGSVKHVGAAMMHSWGKTKVKLK